MSAACRHSSDLVSTKVLGARLVSTSGAHIAKFDPKQFVKECWLATSRESERKSDQKWHRTEKKWYRIRWLEQKLDDVLNWMLAAGTRKFGPDFHLSNFKMKSLIPWFVRKPGRETCMCRYHMEFDHFCDAFKR